ncbi:MAG: SurA N-terminal domain-containing protein [Candidatus Thiothrix putei]|uniref:SurA N-terminal domain-containing protein n=1 Tax=Candidatus Thiothrix putei TaxID=3080811 RepID=A0AA95H9F0_9GAMM|nr:MAG: SurA N-terminal domain-containing protein [Candidatus Thiothrix putei]
MDMNKLTLSPLLSATALALLLTVHPVQADNTATPLDQIAAVVNSDVVMMSEAQQRAQILRSSSQAAASLAAPVLLKQAVDNLILEKLQLQQADAAGIQIDDVTLNKTIAGIAQRNQLSLPAFQQALQQEGIDYAEFREQTRRKLMADALRKREVERRVQATSAEAAGTQAEEQFQAWLQELRNEAYVEYRIPVERSGLTLQ